MLLDHDRHGWHLPHDTAKSWKQLEQTLCYIAKRLRDWFRAASPTKQFLHIEPKFPSDYGYFSSHSTEVAARSGISHSLDAFAVYLAYVSFLVAICQFTGKPTNTPGWLICLEPPDVIPCELVDIFEKLNILNYYGNQKRQLPVSVHPEFLNMFKKSHVVDFSGRRARMGAILRCEAPVKYMDFDMIILTCLFGWHHHVMPTCIYTACALPVSGRDFTCVKLSLLNYIFGQAYLTA